MEAKPSPNGEVPPSGSRDWKIPSKEEDQEEHGDGIERDPDGEARRSLFHSKNMRRHPREDGRIEEKSGSRRERRLLPRERAEEERETRHSDVNRLAEGLPARQGRHANGLGETTARRSSRYAASASIHGRGAVLVEALVERRVEDGAWRAASRTGELRGRDGFQRDVRASRETQGLPCDLVPRRVSSVREVDDAGHPPVDERADRRREVDGERRPPDLVVDDGQLARPGLDALEDRIDEVHTARPEHPGRAQDEDFVPLLERAALARDLAAAVCVHGVHGIVLAVGADALPAEHVVRRDVDEGRADLGAARGEEADRDVVHARVPRIRLGGVHPRVGGRVEDETDPGCSAA